jgi:hypothetical protein
MKIIIIIMMGKEERINKYIEFTYPLCRRLEGPVFHKKHASLAEV